MITGNPAFCLALYLLGVDFKKITCRPIRTQGKGGVRLQEELYEAIR